MNDLEGVGILISPQNRMCEGTLSNSRPQDLTISPSRRQEMSPARQNPRRRESACRAAWVICVGKGVQLAYYLLRAKCQLPVAVRSSDLLGGRYPLDLSLCETLHQITIVMSRRKVSQLPGKFIPALLIERGSLEAIAAQQYHLAPTRTGFPFGRF